MICASPAFDWVEERAWWSACTTCGRLAWDHEQADPMADMRNAVEAARLGQSARDYPPAMRGASS